MKKRRGPGKPLKFSTPEDLQQVINKYFNNTNQEEYTVSGLALEVGSKQLLQDYELRPGYSDIVKRAKLIVELSYELSLRKHGRSADIFALKNFGWKDTQTNVVTQIGVGSDFIKNLKELDSGQIKSRARIEEDADT